MTTTKKEKGFSKTDVTKKHRNFTFTLYNIDESQSDKLGELYDKGFVKLILFTHERGETGNNPHIQGYLMCNNPNKLLTVKNKINALFDIDPNPHIEIAIKPPEDNFKYCTKELKEHPEYKHRLYGEMPLPPGKKRDDTKFESYVSLLEKGEITLKEIEERDLAHYVRHEAHYLSVRSKLAKKEVRPPTFVAWFSGTTGTGKSYTADKIAKRLGFEVYEAGCDNGFFNAYNGEECSVWDDYRSGPITFATLLRITDRNGCTINIKGGKVFFSPKIQIFTSPEGIESAKTNEMKSGDNPGLDNKFEQLKRRINFTAEFMSSTTKTLVPMKEIERESGIVQEKFLGAYKQFLMDTGYEQFIELIKPLSGITPIKVKKLIETDENNTLTSKCNV